MDHEGTIDAEALRQAVAESFDETIGQLTDLVAIPGIAWPSFDPAPLNRSADAVASLVRASGFDDVRILRCDKEDGTPGGPAVVARRPAAEGKPTVLLYAHHDVQPTGDLALWETDPFTAVERDGRLFGRGAADDKAGILAHIAAYSAVTRVLGDELGLGVTFFFEGEEEAGSPTFRQFLETHRELLRADQTALRGSLSCASYDAEHPATRRAAKPSTEALSSCCILSDFQCSRSRPMCDSSASTSGRNTSVSSWRVSGGRCGNDSPPPRNNLISADSRTDATR